MKIDPYVEQLKDKNVIAMVSAESTQVDFYYVEGNETKVKNIFGNRYKLFKQYATVCGLQWERIGIGKGKTLSRNFMNGRLFVPLRKNHGLMYIDLKYYKGLTKRDGQNYVELTDGTLIECCDSSKGNENKIAEAKNIAVSLPGFENYLSVQHSLIAPAVVPLGVQKLQVSPVCEPSMVKERKKPQKPSTSMEGKLTQDVIGAVLLEKEIQSCNWLHVQDMDQKSLDYKRIQCSKKAAIEQIGETFFDILAHCEMLSS